MNGKRKRTFSRRIAQSVSGLIILVILIVVANEIFDIPSLIFGGPPTPINWIEVGIEAFVVATLGSFVILYLRRLWSGREQAEEATKLAYAELNQIFDTAPDAMRVIDKNFNVLRMNQAYSALSGRGKDQVLGKKCYELPNSGLCETPDCPLTRIVRGEERVELEIEVGGNEASRIPCILTATPFREVGGQLVGMLQGYKDITERKQAEEALRGSEERYRTILEQIQDSYFEMDLAGNVTFCNNTMCHDLGYSRRELLGMNYQAYVAAEDVEAVFRVSNKTYRTGTTGRMPTFKFARKDGSTGFGETWLSPLRNEAGEIIGFRGLSRDITERKQAEEALRESEQKYHDIFNDVSDFLYSHDLEGYFTDTNLAFRTQYGFSEDDLVNLNVRDLIPERYRHGFEDYFKAVLEQGKDESLMKVVTKDGRERIVEYRNSLVCGATGPIGVRGSARDITERKEAERALRDTEEKYRGILNDMQDAYYEVDLAGNFTFFDDSLCQLLGYCREEMMGMNYRVYTPEENVEAVYKTYNQVYRTGKPAKWFSWEQVRKDGRRYFAETSVYPLQNQARDIIGFRGVSRDISERKAAEQQLLTTSKLASVGELASGVAHELNNPLTGIIGYAQLLTSRGNVPQDIKTDLDRIYHESQRAAKIVQNLLSFARQRKPHKGYLDVNELIQKTLELRDYELRTSNIGIYVNLAPGLPWVIADYHQIQQVILNILINAEQALAEGKRRGKITVTTSAVEGYVEISIADNGPGIATEDIGRLFDPFFTTKEVGSGTGLGLSVCHGIVTEHGGKIDVESQKGKGATFTIELPLATQREAVVEEKEAAAKTSRPQRQRANGRILIVDDEPSISDVLTRALSEHGYVTDSALTAKTALQKIAGNNYELYIIDLKMPRTSGKRLYQIMRQRYPSLAEKVVFITGDTTTPATENFLASTGKPYLAKPFSSDQVIELVEETLGGRQ